MGKPLERMISEATEIKRMLVNERKKVLNSKVEFNRTVVPDISEEGITREELEEVERVDKIIEKLQTEKRNEKKGRVDNRRKGTDSTPEREANNETKRQRKSFQQVGNQSYKFQETGPENTENDGEYGVTPSVNLGQNGPPFKEHSTLRLGGLPPTLGPVKPK